MVQHEGFGGAVTVGVPPHESVLIHVTPTGSDDHPLSGEIVGSVAALAAIASRARVVTWGLLIDTGFGLQTVLPSEFTVLQVHEDVDEWADTLMVELHGPQYSPLRSAAFRGLLPLRLHLEIGAPSGTVDRLTFTGYGVQSSYDPSREVLTLTALDEAAKHAEKIVPFEFDPETMTSVSRERFLVNTMTANGVPVGEVDLGQYGRALMTKPFSLADQRLLEIGRDFVAPSGARIYFREGKLTAVAPGRRRPIAREFHPADIISFEEPLQPPVAATPNTFTNVTVRYERDEPNGETTKTTEQRVFGFYAVKGAVSRQIVSRGVPTTTAVNHSDPTETFQEVSRIVTTLTFRGDLMVRMQVVEWGYYAPHAARLQFNSDGTVSERNSSTTWLYADGAWRRDPRETWQPVNMTVTRRELDEDGYVVTTTEDRYRWRFFAKALWKVGGGGTIDPILTGAPHLLTEGGEGVVFASELFGRQANSYNVLLGFAGAMPDERTVMTVDVGDEGAITLQTESTFIQGRGSKRTPTSTSHGYGLTEIEWFELPWEGAIIVAGLPSQLSVRRTLGYTQLSKTIYSTTETLVTVNGLKSGGNDVQVRTSTATGTGPRAERLEATTSAQEVRLTATDSVRVGLVGGVIEDFVQNEFCQTDADQQRFLDAMIREAAAFRLGITIPLQQSLHKGMWVRVYGFPRSGIDGLECLIKAVILDGDALVQRLVLLHYPAEVS